MTLFRQEALDHKRRKLYGEVILKVLTSFRCYFLDVAET